MHPMEYIFLSYKVTFAFGSDSQQLSSSVFITSLPETIALWSTCGGRELLGRAGGMAAGTRAHSNHPGRV